jgi:glycosyltransferase involved in cell wall biosynthesis
MSSTRPSRVLWLLNHTTLRHFEVDQLQKIGISEIFIPKNFPYDEGNLSASVTYELDETLTLLPDEVSLLNDQDWYGTTKQEVWDLVNRHFDIAFIGFFPNQIVSVCRNFKGAIVLRAFGLGGEETYSKLIRKIGGPSLQSSILTAGKRFWFGMGYAHLADGEDSFIADRAVFMPVGLRRGDLLNEWIGEDRAIFFVCPRIGSSPYFKRVYESFLETFRGLPYRIGGAQPIAVNDPNVCGFLSHQQYSTIMRQSRVMFYHSQEANLIHYHPFEAIRVGMPLIFMAGGMLDLMGGSGLPGRCTSLVEARRKIERILANDQKLIDRIRSTQTILLDSMRPENCKAAWQSGFKRVILDLEAYRDEQTKRPALTRLKRAAVIVPIGYRGGSLRGAMALAQALYVGSRQMNEAAEVVFAHLDDPMTYAEDTFDDLYPGVMRRSFQWKILSSGEARRAMRYAGFDGWEPTAENYIVPEDGMRQFLDCDVWVIISDRLSYPILPIRPVVLMVYDYLQRYVDLLAHGADAAFLSAARSADKVLVTTEFTYRDAAQYAGVRADRLSKVPMLAPEFPILRQPATSVDAPPKFFLWTTNAAPHKNHLNAAEALRWYYEEFEGQLDCRVTGVNTKNMLTSELPHLKSMAEIFGRSKLLRRRVKWMGELPEAQYRQILSSASFLWHASRVDTWALSVIEAACLGVPALSSDYPAMQEIDRQFSLNMAWMNPASARDMAKKLKEMEIQADLRRSTLPSAAELHAQRVESHAKAYWQEIRSCL